MTYFNLTCNNLFSCFVLAHLLISKCWSCTCYSLSQKLKMMVRIRGLKIPIYLDIKPKFCSCQKKKPKFCSFGYYKYDISLFQILTLSILNSVTCFFTIVSHLSDIDSNFITLSMWKTY
jgi:hypothetical protein